MRTRAKCRAGVVVFRFIHTADWQIGMMATGLGAAAPKARAARLESIGAVLDLANDQRVDAILIAGDQFEDNQVSPTDIEQVANLLSQRTRIPTYLIPGNHDPFNRHSVYHRPVWNQLGSHVHLMTQPQQVALADEVVLYACPLHRKNGAEDPTAWIPVREDGKLRIGLAHGTMQMRPDMGDDDFPIPTDTPHKRDLDYLALGHWHSTLSSPCGRAWYSGTHETTKFGERDSGNTLLVELESPRSAPRVTPIRCGSLTWVEEQIDLDVSSLDRHITRLRERDNTDRYLLKLKLTGEADGPNAAGLTDLHAMLGGKYLYHTCDDSSLRPAVNDSSLSILSASPHLLQTAQQLDALARGQAVDPTISATLARRALQLLHKAAWESRSR